jgi:hypothetical protein
MKKEGGRIGLAIGSLLGMTMATVLNPALVIAVWVQNAVIGMQTGKRLGAEAAPRNECNKCGQQWKA